jgi:hypothetical protein
MKEFDFRKYLKQNPLLKESVNEKFSNWKNWKPGFEDFWDRVYDGAIEKAIEISKESGDGMNIEEISKAIENECANPNRVMQAFEADGEVDEAIHYVLDSLEIGEPMGMGATQNAFIRNKANRIGYNPMREDEDSMSEGDSVIFDKGWEYDDDDFGSDDLDDFNPQDERERFLGLGGQEILDGIKFLIDDGFELEDIMKQIKQHSNYLQSPTMNEGMNDDDSENPFPSLNQNNDDSLFGPNIEKSRPGNLSDYYRNAEPLVKQVASQIDKVLEGVGIREEELINLTDLIIDLSDAYAEERIDLYNSDNSFN